MAHHKRKGPKSTRAGCLLCHPQKHQAEDRRTVQEKRAPEADEWDDVSQQDLEDWETERETKDKIADFILDRWEGTLKKLAEDD